MLTIYLILTYETSTTLFGMNPSEFVHRMLAVQYDPGIWNAFYRPYLMFLEFM